MSVAAPSTASAPRLLRLFGVAQQYEWGKIGAASAVGQLMQAAADNAAKVDAAAASPSFTLNPSAPYAELWLGTHPSGPSRVQLHSEDKAADANAAVLLRSHLSSDLPFLFKVLSVGKALSVQAHPDSSLAARLHATRPAVYKDPHHKPELACALTPFEAMCQFRPIQQMAELLSTHPEAAALIGEERMQTLQAAAEVKKNADAAANSSNSDEEKRAIRGAFEAIMTADAALVKVQLDAMVKRLQEQGVKASVPACEQQPQGADSFASSSAVTSLAVDPLILRLSASYPGDVGVFAPLLLSCLLLPPGSALFLGPNSPHAYLSGDCVECMAGSDNVVRAGLTPKLRDTEVLVDMLTYESATEQQAVMTPGSVGSGVVEFKPPQQFPEFRLVRAEIKAAGASSSSSSVFLPSVVGPSILLVYSGAGEAETSSNGSSSAGTRQSLRRGDTFLVPAGTALTLQRDQANEDGLLVFQCTANTQ